MSFSIPYLEGVVKCQKLWYKFAEVEIGSIFAPALRNNKGSYIREL